MSSRRARGVGVRGWGESVPQEAATSERGTGPAEARLLAFLGAAGPSRCSGWPATRLHLTRMSRGADAHTRAHSTLTNERVKRKRTRRGSTRSNTHTQPTHPPTHPHTHARTHARTRVNPMTEWRNVDAVVTGRRGKARAVTRSWQAAQANDVRLSDVRSCGAWVSVVSQPMVHHQPLPPAPRHRRRRASPLITNFAKVK
jgi:hypothetical protein